MWVSLHTEEKSNSLEALRIPGMCGLLSLCTCLCNEDYFIKPSCASAEEIPSLIITHVFEFPLLAYLKRVVANSIRAMVVVLLFPQWYCHFTPYNRSVYTSNKFPLMFLSYKYTKRLYANLKRKEGKITTSLDHV